ncbi:hypothetical protein [Comamonas sp. JC664]|uniref:hypothetical protein n=1 Tax=Comamonas sp. JC664 TaxID=2801917 RepID=UPI0017480EB9|nr:hypothetical protein [Comamonas sp. JC664]MBL0694967.1 hypothetical protein [Comamonas sp. JC664]GHH02371.1 hypothetical protein GCM10012319_70620 [Comamonas sp. KCTC 72670]
MNRRHLLTGALALAAMSMALGGCGSESERRTFPVEVTSLPITGANERGWTVTVDTAHLSVGPVRFFEGRALQARRFDWYSLIGGTAHAHPGHYSPGDALAEVLSTLTVDLLTGATLGDASAVTGAYGSMELTLPAPTTVTDAQGVLSGHGMRVRGTARNAEGATVRFDAMANLSKPIEGVRFEKTLGTEPGRVRITVKLATWLGRIDFATATDPDADGVYTFPADSQAQNALVRGVEDTTAYDVTWVEGAAQ